MEALKTIPYIFLILAVAGIIAGASMLSIGSFGTQMTQCDTAGSVYADADGVVYNSTLQTGADLYACVNAAHDALAGDTTDAYRATLHVTEGMSTVSQQFPTIGIIAIMVIIISLIAGVMVYMAYFR